MKKIVVIALMMFLCGVVAVSAEDAVTYTIETQAEVQFERDYEFKFDGESDIDVELTSQTYTVGCAIDMGNLTLTPRIGIWDGEANIEGEMIVEGTTGVALGISGAWLLAEPIEDLKVSLIGDYSYGHSTVDKIKYMNIVEDFSKSTDIYKNDFEGGIRLAYSGIPMNGIAELGLVYSRSTIDVEIADAIDLELEATENFGLRPAISFSPKENVKVSIAGKLVDQKALVGKISYKF